MRWASVRALDDVLRRAEVLADEVGFVPVEGPLQVRRQESVLHVHSRSETQLGHATDDQRLVGRLLGVLGEQDDPPDIECAVYVIVAAMHIQRMLGQRPGDHLDHHGRGLSGGVIVLLDAVDDALARSEVDHTRRPHTE